MPLSVVKPKLIPFSPVTVTDSGLSGTAPYEDELYVDNINAFPAVGANEIAYAVLCDNERFISDDPGDYEVIAYTGITGSTLTGVIRGVEGTIQTWPTETTFIACSLTMTYLEKIWEELENVNEKFRFMGAMVRSPGQTVSNESNTTLDWGSADYDTDGFWSAGANSDKLIIPADLGIKAVRLSLHLNTKDTPIDGRVRAFMDDSYLPAPIPTTNWFDINNSAFRRWGGTLPVIKVQDNSELGVNVWHNHGSERTVEDETYLSLQVVEREIV